MKIVFYSNIYMLICSVISLSYGLHKIFNSKKTAMYFQFGVFTMLCIVLSRLFYTVSIVCFGELPQIFNIGFIGYCAMFMFLFFSNYGQIDKLVDDRKTVKPIYRIIPAVISVPELAAGIAALLFGTVQFSVRLSFLVMTILAGLAGYYNLKHMIIPDIEFGIVKSIKAYNLTALFLEILTLAEIGLSCFGINEPIIFVQAALGIIYAVTLPILHKGVTKWTQ